MSKTIIFALVVPLVVFLVLLRACQMLAPTSLERPKVTQADAIRAEQIAAETARKEQAIETPTISTETTPVEVKRFETVEEYFSDGNPKPISHRRGLPNFERDVSEKTKKEVKKRDGGCCLVCGSTYQLEVDHRIALMNGGDNSKDNLGTLCDSCHKKKTRLDYRVRKRRE